MENLKDLNAKLDELERQLDMNFKRLLMAKGLTEAEAERIIKEKKKVQNRMHNKKIMQTKANSEGEK